MAYPLWHRQKARDGKKSLGRRPTFLNLPPPSSCELLMRAHAPEPPTYSNGQARTTQPKPKGHTWDETGSTQHTTTEEGHRTCYEADSDRPSQPPTYTRRIGTDTQEPKLNETWEQESRRSLHHLSYLFQMRSFETLEKRRLVSHTRQSQRRRVFTVITVLTSSRH